MSWWRHQMETFSGLLAICAGNSPVPICAGNSPVPGEFPTQRPVTRNFDIFFDLCPNKPLSKQWWGWWFETPSYPLLCHCYCRILTHCASYVIWRYRSCATLVMTCRVFGATPQPKTMLTYCQLDFRNKLRWIFNWNWYIFIEKN